MGITVVVTITRGDVGMKVGMKVATIYSKLRCEPKCGPHPLAQKMWQFTIEMIVFKQGTQTNRYQAKRVYH